MFKSKKDVDRHVQDVFRKVKNENERNLRCYTIGKLYYQIGDYESAKRYVSTYLEVREGSAGAHKLLGQALEALGQKEAALSQYKVSLELEGRQDDLVLKVCELLVDMDLEPDINKVKYWVDRADSMFPHHPIVFQLKEKLLMTEKPNENNTDLEALISSELAARPTSVQLRVKLLKHYISQNKLDDAYKHAADVEATRGYRNCIDWYQCLSELLAKCEESKHNDWSFWVFYVSALERYVALSLREQGPEVKKTVPEATQAVFNFDQTLTKFKSKEFSNDAPFTEHMLMHMSGQLHYHLACLLLRKTKREQGSWSETGRLCAPLLLCALHATPVDPSAPWCLHLKDQLKNHVRLWYKEGSYRCSQAGHVLQDYAGLDSKKLMDKVDKFCTGPWRERIYQRIFTNRVYQHLMRTSYFTNHVGFNPRLRLCSHGELKQYDEVSEEVWPDSLHHQVWLGIKNRPHSKDNEPYPHQYSHVFPELQFSVYNLNQAAPDTLSRLDIDAFLNAAVLCSSAIAEDQQLSRFVNPERLPTLPADLTGTLCTTAQEKWWSSAYKMYSKQGDMDGDIGEIRQELQRGLEVVRCIGNHGLHSSILVHLARIFHYRVKVLKEKDKEHCDIPALESRCELYWSTAVPLLERLQNNQTIRVSSSKLFNYQGKEMNNVELSNALEEGKLLLAQRFVRDKQYEQAIDALQVLKCPEASFQQGQIFKILADELVSSMPRESLTSEMRSQHIIMLSKARNCFYLTLDRLRSPGTNPKHPLNSELCSHISDIENELKRIDPDLWHNDMNRNECDGLSDESYSSAHSGTEQTITSAPLQGLSTINASTNILSTPQRNTCRIIKQSSTPCRPQHHDLVDLSRNRTEARPSPERLDAQIRQMIHSRDNVMQTIIEQNKAVLDSYKTLVEQNKAVLDSHKTIVDKIDDLAKRINTLELRKETQKQQHGQQQVLNPNVEEDMFVLGEEDYNELNYSAGQSDPSSTMSGNMFATPHRNPYSQLVYPSATAFQGYYQGGIPFNDPHTQAIPPLYPPNVYPVPVIYPNRSKIPENILQQGLFSQRLPTQLPDFMSPVSQSLQMPSSQPLQNVQNLPNVQNVQSVQNVPNAQNVQNVQNVQPKLDVIKTDTTRKDLPVNKSPPVNVVITTSDTLPTTVPSVQPVLSVTIPPHYRSGGGTPTMTKTTTIIERKSDVPHCYQISMPPQATIPTTVNLPPLSTTLTIIPSSITMPDETRENNVSIASVGSLNNSNESCEVEHDPIPDFVPVIPLPAEVKVTTGEEDETTLYCARAKLFRFVEKEWKERGVGDVKLLKNSEGKVRLLMRRDQVLKICANHLLSPDMELTPMLHNEKAWVWVANDFADEEVRLEKLCIRFKTVEEATKFKEHFDMAKMCVSKSPVKSTGDKSHTNVNVAASTPVTSSSTGQIKESADIKSNQKQSVETPESKGKSGTITAGGFSFTSTPIQNAFPEPVEKTKQTQKQDSPKVNPFSVFSFNKSNKSSETATNVTPSVVTTQANNLFAKTTASFVFSSSNNAASTTVTSTSDTTVTTSQSGGNPDASTTRTTLRRPHAPPPASRSTSSGVENETVLFDQKIALQKYNRDNKQWEEKSTVQLKVLSNIKTGKLRLSTIVDQNSKISYSPELADTKFAFKKDSNTIISVHGKENKTKKYSLTFKSPEQAAQFYALVSPHQKVSKESKSLETKKQESQKSEKSEKSNETSTNSNITVVDTTKSLAEMFKPPAGSWTCDACYTRNDAAQIKCVACETPSPISSNVTSTTPSSVASISSNSTNQIPLSEMFKAPAGSWKCDSCLVLNTSSNNYCVACDSPKDPSMPPKPATKSAFNFGTSVMPDSTPTFSFGIPKETAKEAATGFTFRMPSVVTSDSTSTTTNLPIFGGTTKSTESSAKFTFGATPQEPTTPEKNCAFTFGSPGKSFSFQFSTKSPSKSPGGGECSEEEVVESDDIQFSPIIPLPDKVEVKTGEEDEEVLYSHRAKLFRFDTAGKEWKERGLGDIKLLKHRVTGKLRLLMRRDQVLKLCLNHFVLPDIEFTPKDDKTWLWNAADYSEGEIEYMQFACRFKTTEIAESFKNAIDEARKSEISNESTRNAKTKELTKTSSSHDIQILYELQVTPEEKAAALKLQLPENFYAYKQKEDCPGCLGCKEPSVPLFLEKNVENSSGNITKSEEEKQFSFSTITGDSTTKSNTTVGTGDLSNSITTTPTTSASSVFSGFSFAKSGLKSNLLPSTINFANDTFTTTNDKKTTGFVFGSAGGQTNVNQVANFTTGSSTQSNVSDNANVSLDALNVCSTTTENQVQKSAHSIFGGSMFGRSSFGDTSTVSSTFGNTATTKSDFLSTSGNTGKSIFGGGTKTGSTSLIKPPSFNVSNENLSSTSNNNFSNTRKTTSPTESSSAPTSSIKTSTFGVTTNTSVFSASTDRTFGSTTSAPGSTIFGSNLSGNTFDPNKSTSNVFSTPSTIFSTTFNAPSNSIPTFGSSNMSDVNKVEGSKSDDVNAFLSTNNTLLFSTLAVKNAQQEGFKTDPNFSFAGAGSTVFGSFANKNKQTKEQVAKNDNEDDNENEENVNEEEHDPQFEPIVPLPDAIEVRTGEEDEEKVFCHRAKLYRYDNNLREWKERGVGEMKILHHVGYGSYRLLLRREQVHKVVCNILIKPDMEFRTLSSSDRAWMWAGMNHAEDMPCVEELAIKFKSPELAAQFKQVVDRIQQELREKQNRQVDKYETEVKQDEQEVEDEDDEDEDEVDDDEEEDEDDDDETSVLFEKRATLFAQTSKDMKWKHVGLGNLTIYYDSNIFGAKIILKSDEHDILSNTLISIDTVMNLNEKECIWSALDYAFDPPIRRTLKAIFSSTQAAEQMYKYYQEGLDYAREADITEPTYEEIQKTDY